MMLRSWNLYIFCYELSPEVVVFLISRTISMTIWENRHASQNIRWFVVWQSIEHNTLTALYSSVGLNIGYHGFEINSISHLNTHQDSCNYQMSFSSLYALPRLPTGQLRCGFCIQEFANMILLDVT